MNVASLCIRIFEKRFIDRGGILLLVKVAEIFREHFVIYHGYRKLTTDSYRVSFDNTFVTVHKREFSSTSTKSRISP